MNKVAIIPARMSATRFPGKPMRKICGIPMIAHCLKRVEMWRELSGVYVATCDQEIYDYITSIGGKAVMTADTHTRATDRTCEAMLKIEKETGKKIDVCIMVQGDEPMVTPEMVKKSCEPFADDSSVQVVNLMSDLDDDEEFDDPNEVKVVCDLKSRALYFSREAIPSRRKGGKNYQRLKQVCIIPFKRDYLIKFGQMKETPLEIIESVDMMRILENGDQVHMVYCADKSYSVDTQEDLSFVEMAMKNDKLLPLYKKECFQ